jgi:hypothetical protein
MELINTVLEVAAKAFAGAILVGSSCYAISSTYQDWKNKKKRKEG